MVCPAGGSQRLPRMVGITQAKELIFTGGVRETLTCCYRHSSSFSEGLHITLSLSLLSGKCVGGQTALEMGLVNRAVEQNEAEDAAYREALSLAREILPQVRTQTVFPVCCGSDTDASFLLQDKDMVFLPASPLLSCPPFSSLFLVFSSHLSLLPPSLPSLQASVAPYFFHSGSDARSWQGQSGSQVEKWTTNSTTNTRVPTDTYINWHMLVLARIE